MLEIRNKGDIWIARVKGSDRLNASISEPVREQLAELFGKPNTKLALDLKGIRYIDSSGFGIFLTVLKAANNNNGQFKLCNVTGEVMELFQLLQLHHVFEIYDQLEPCLASFNS
jgi:anti-sigma B factor antagonist